MEDDKILTDTLVVINDSDESVFMIKVFKGKNVKIESNITEFKRIVLKNKFLKIYSDGSGTYQNIK